MNSFKNTASNAQTKVHKQIVATIILLDSTKSMHYNIQGASSTSVRPKRTEIKLTSWPTRKHLLVFLTGTRTSAFNPASVYKLSSFPLKKTKKAVKRWFCWSFYSPIREETSSFSDSLFIIFQQSSSSRKQWPVEVLAEIPPLLGNQEGGF